MLLEIRFRTALRRKSFQEICLKLNVLYTLLGLSERPLTSAPLPEKEKKRVRPWCANLSLENIRLASYVFHRRVDEKAQ